MSETEENVVRIPVNSDSIEGNLVVPAGAKGVVLFGFSAFEYAELCALRLFSRHIF
jgi:hypothetical protein